MFKNLFKKQCPDDETVACYIDGLLPEKEKILVDKHLKACSDCREAFAIHREVADRLKVEEPGPVPEYLVESAKNLWAERQGADLLDIVVTVVEDFVQGLKTTGDIIAGVGEELRPMYSSFKPIASGALRKGGQEKTHTVLVRKVFDNVCVEVSVSRLLDEMNTVTLKVSDARRKEIRKDVRATLIQDAVELESYSMSKGQVTFECVRVGKYLIKVLGTKGLIGTINLELKQS